MVDCRKCKNLFLKKTSEFTSMYACKLDMLPEVSVGMVRMPTECSGYEDIVEGKKYDTGKNHMGLMCENFSRALWEVGRVGTFGCSKYGENSWQNLDNAKSRYLDALCRHLFKHLQGEKVDDESGLLHLSHLAWNSLCLLEFELKDDNMCCALKKALKESEENNG